MRATGGDDGLEVIAIFAGDADFVAFDGGGGFEFGVADELADFFSDGRFESLLDFDGLSRVAKW